MMKSMNKLGLYVPPAMRNPKDAETDTAVPKNEGRKVAFAIPAPRVEVYKSSNRENHPPGFGPAVAVEGAPSARELPAPKPAPLAAICRNAAVASRKRTMADDRGDKSGDRSGANHPVQRRRGRRSRRRQARFQVPRRQGQVGVVDEDRHRRHPQGQRGAQVNVRVTRVCERPSTVNHRGERRGWGKGRRSRKKREGTRALL